MVFGSLSVAVRLGSRGTITVVNLIFRGEASFLFVKLHGGHTICSIGSVLHPI